MLKIFRSNLHSKISQQLNHFLVQKCPNYFKLTSYISSRYSLIYLYEHFSNDRNGLISAVIYYFYLVTDLHSSRGPPQVHIVPVKYLDIFICTSFNLFYSQNLKRCLRLWRERAQCKNRRVTGAARTGQTEINSNFRLDIYLNGIKWWRNSCVQRNSSPVFLFNLPLKLLNAQKYYIYPGLAIFPLFSPYTMKALNI